MKRVLYLIAISFILLLTASILAVGSSSGGSSGGGSSGTSKYNTLRDTPKVLEIKKVARERCEEITVRKERIKCRVEYIKQYKEEFESEYDSYPEVCRKLNTESKENCKTFYKDSYSCYKKSGTAKNKCFKRMSNFARAKLKDEIEGRNKKSRDYIVLLLYDIQEKIEKGIEDDKIEVSDGTTAIDLIVQLKEMILNGRPKSEIKPKLQEFKDSIRKIKSDINKY